MNLSKDNLIIWDILKLSILVWPISSLPFMLYFGLHGDDPKTAFSRSLIASAVTIAAMIVIAFGIRYAVSKLNKSN